MKYKVGDKIKIKTWKEIEKDYWVDGVGRIDIPGDFYFTRVKEEALNKESPNRILTIKEIIKNRLGQDCYTMKEINWYWYDWMIEGLYKKPIPIFSRFEILDL